MQTEADQPRPRPHVHEHRHADLRPAVGWARGSGTASAPRPRTCPASSCSPRTGRGGQMQPIAARQWHSGFLPSRFQGVHFRSQGRRGALPARPRGRRRRAQQRDVIDAVAALNADAARLASTTPRSPTRISQYEMAFRMQTSVPGLMDLVERAASTSSTLYGIERRRRLASPPTACSPGGWPSAACASSSSTTATGTTTAASRTTSR